MDSIAAQNEIISISSDSPDQSIADVGTERTNVNPIRDTPGIDVLPSIETPDSNTINDQVMEYVLQKRPDLTRGEVLFFSLPLPVRYRIYEYHEILYRSISEVSEDGTVRLRASSTSTKQDEPVSTKYNVQLSHHISE